jgi:formate dehydrogenase subunit delta
MPIVVSDVAAASLRAATPSVCERPDGRTVEVIAKFSVGCEQNETSLAREVIARTAFGMKPRQQRRPPMSHENSAEKLVYMANQIRKFFASQGEGVAVRGTAEHLKKLWDSCMREMTLRHLAAGGDDLDPIASMQSKSSRIQRS